MTTGPERHDIENRADCERLVRAFYARAMVDPIIGFLFVDVAKLDLEAHVPQITSFWETMLLDVASYNGRPFRPHLGLNAKTPIKRGHFERWLFLLHKTVDELFIGERAELAKSHATRVANAFHERLRASEQDQADPDRHRPAELPIVQHHGRAGDN